MLTFFRRKGANLVPIVLAFVPLLGLIVLAMAAVGTRLKPGSGAAVLFLSVIALAAAAVSLSKVRPAPFLIYFSVVVAFLGKWALDAAWEAFSESARAYDTAGYGGSGTWWLFAAFALAATVAYLRQSAFDRDWSLAPVPLWAFEEAQRFFKDTSSAPRRALIAAALIVVGFVVVGFAMPGSNGVPSSAACRYGCAATIVTLVVVAIGLFCTILRIPDEEINATTTSTGLETE